LEEERGDLALELSDGPALAGGLDLVESTRLGALDGQQESVVGPGQDGREEHGGRDRRWVPQRGTFRRSGRLERKVPHRGTFLGAAQLGRDGRAVREGPVELPHALEAGDVEALAELAREPGGELLDQLVPVQIGRAS